MSVPAYCVRARHVLQVVMTLLRRITTCKKRKEKDFVSKTNKSVGELASQSYVLIASSQRQFRAMSSRCW